MRKVEEMTDWGRLLYKLMVIHDIFEVDQLTRVLKTVGFSRSPQAIGFYLRGDRNPPPDFFDYVKDALDLDDSTYKMLLYTYHQSKPQASPRQREQMQEFEQMLFERQAGGLLKSVSGTTN